MNKIRENLLKQNIKTPKFSLKDKVFLAKCVKCYDADTIHVIITLNEVYSRFTCRLLGIDTAEIRSKDENEKKYAIIARDYLRNIILDKLIIITCGEFDKYGRLLITIFEDNNTNFDNMLGGSINNLDNPSDFKFSINNQLIENKLAYSYTGATKKKFIEWCDIDQLGK